MKKFTIFLSPEIAAVVSHLHPDVKRKIRSALEDLVTDPHKGKALREPLEGLYSYRVAHYRIVYEISKTAGRVEIADIAARKIVTVQPDWQTAQNKAPKNLVGLNGYELGRMAEPI